MCYKQSWQGTHIPVNNDDFNSHATGLSLKKKNQNPPENRRQLHVKSEVQPAVLSAITRHRFMMAIAGRVPWICQGPCTQGLRETCSLKFFQRKYCSSPGKFNQHVIFVFSILMMTQLRYKDTDSWKGACKWHTHVNNVLVWLRNKS